MAIILPVQTASFKGIYTLEKGILMPKALDLYNITANTTFEFENRRGLTFIYLRNKTSNLAFITIFVTRVVEDNPFPIEVADSLWYLLPSAANIIGPLSNSFDVASICSFRIDKISPTNPMSIDLAVIKLPEGGV